MGGIGIITDSTSGMTAEMADEYDIKVLPLKLMFEDETFLDGVNLSDRDFLRKLETSPKLPTTSQPTPGEFMQAYEDMGKKYDHILSVHISSRISGTIESAMAAARNLKDLKIDIIDSKVTSISLLILVQRLAKAVREGLNVDAVMELSRKVISHLDLYLTVDTLEYLHKGGRIGAAQNLVGSVLKLRPVLFYQEGIVDALEKVRGRQKSLQRLVELAAEKLKGVKTQLGIAYFQDKAAAEEVRDMALKSLNVDPADVLMNRTSAVVAAHASPGAVGIGFFPAV
ncbi:MAG: DegV family protein [Candidatus Geothermincolia bacterium]